MKVFYSPYVLTPLKRANRLSSLEKKHGVFLKIELNRKVTFADYFPHIPLGDRSADQFLSEFKYQNEEYDKKIFHLLLNEHRYQNKFPTSKFRNHQLWTGSEALESNIIKYKLTHNSDKSFLTPLQRGVRVRLDGNGLFNRAELGAFLSEIPKAEQALIEYMEDPVTDQDWKDIGVKSAKDFLTGSPNDYYIYKPNCEFKPETDAKVIYSAYLGSDLGQWHTYSEMMESADLDLVHGIIASGFYEEENSFFRGDYTAGFHADANTVRKIYKDVDSREWKLLCSM